MNSIFSSAVAQFSSVKCDYSLSDLYISVTSQWSLKSRLESFFTEFSFRFPLFVARNQ